MSMKLVTTTAKASDAVHLKARADWPTWYTHLKTTCLALGVWQHVNPDAPDAVNYLVPYEAPPPTMESFTISKNHARQVIWLQELTAWTNEQAIIVASSTTASPSTNPATPAKPKPIEPLPLTFADLKDEFIVAEKSYLTRVLYWDRQGTPVREVYAWLQSTVGTVYLQSVTTRLSISGTITVQLIVRQLREMLAPSDVETTAMISQKYMAVLDLATSGKTRPEAFLSLWNEVYTLAKAYRIAEVTTLTASQTFLHAVQRRIAPDWAKQMLTQQTQARALGLPELTLEQLSKVLSSQIAMQIANNPSSSSNLSFATLGAGEKPPRNTSSGDPSKPSTTYDCPCDIETKIHFHQPIRCRTLIKAVTNNDAEVLKKLSDHKYKKLVKELEDKKIKVAKPPSKPYDNKASGASSAPWPTGNGVSAAVVFPDETPTYGYLSAGVINHQDLEKLSLSFSALGNGLHPLHQATMFDNGTGTHIINDQKLAMRGTLVPASPHDRIDAGASSIAVTHRCKRLMKNALNGPEGPRTRDLVLNNVALCPGFFVNLISESLLLKQKMWFLAFNDTLVYGTPSHHVVLKTMHRHHNVIFFEYKIQSNYSAATLAYPTLVRRIKDSKKLNREAIKQRTASAEVWHARSGHLGPAALEHLVATQNRRSMVRGVQISDHNNITGIPRLKCSHCSLAHATTVVARGPSENAAYRPFWRVYWDLFEFEVAFDACSILLVMKDEFSGKLFSFPLQGKGSLVIQAIQRFEAWVKRQYGLSICKFKHDIESSAIGYDTGFQETVYERWCADLGIEIELPPPATKESTGAAERAGQEVKTRSIKMRSAANLPSELWPEITLAATYLYNKSPLERNGFTSPDERLEAWFREYFEREDPLLVAKITADLRPDWNNLMVYGCRAYVLKKERRTHSDRRAFSTETRANIGYLIGYIASNLYRIWVPALDTVITSRDVKFDENTLYSPETELEEGLPQAVAQEVVRIFSVKNVQDSGSIIENIHLLIDENTDLEEVVREGEEGESDPSNTLSEEQSGSNTGVITVEDKPAPSTSNSTLLLSHRLPSPRATPTPERELGETFQPPPTQRGVMPDTQNTISEKPVVPETITEGALSTGVTGSEPRSEMHSALPSTLQTGRRHTPPPPPPRAITSSQPTRTSRRIQNLGPEMGQGLLSNSVQDIRLETDADHREKLSESTSVNPSAASLAGMLGSKEQLDDFFTTYWPDQSPMYGSLNRDQAQHTTVHAVIAAAVSVCCAVASLVYKATPGSEVILPKLPRILEKDLPAIPKHFKQLATHPYGQWFKASCDTELKNLESRECYRVVDVDKNTTTIPLLWVFKYKVDANGYLVKCKSRIVVRGDLQEESSIISTYAATLAARSFRVAMAIAARFDLEVKVFDVVNAFINATRHPDSHIVICKLPDGYNTLGPGKGIQVDRALYGMRDSPALWHSEFTTTLKRLGLIRCSEESCIYMDKLRQVLVMFYVDDIKILYHRTNEAQANKLISELKKTYELNDLGNIAWFLGVRVIRDRIASKIWLVHDTYITKIASKWKLDGHKCPSTPLPFRIFVKFDGTATKAFIKTYQEKIGSILYTAIMIRPDVAFAAAQLSHFLTNPSQEHMEAADWCLQYLWGTRFLGLVFGGLAREIQELVIASDASFADDVITRRSSMGYVIILFGGPVAWKATRQATVSTSTTEAELLALSETAKESMGLQRLFDQIHLKIDQPWTIYCDNQQTIRLIVSENDRIVTKLRHVDIQNMWLKQEHAKGSFVVTYLPTNDMPADGFTKNLSRGKFEHFREQLHLHDTRGMIESLE